MTKGRMKKAALSMLFCLLIAVAAGCAEPASEKLETDAELTKAAANVLTISWNKDIGDLNPHMYVPNQFFAQAMVYEGLVNYGAGGKIEPSLAQSWDVSDDGKTYTFHLREGVTFSDGTAFTSANVERNFAAVLSNREEHSWLELINQIDAFESTDDYTFVLQLKNQYYPALQELTLIRPLRFLGDAGFAENDDTSKGIAKPVGTGPWILKEYTKDQQAVFVRNESYWGTKPKLQQITVKIIPDSESRVLAFQNGDIDMIYGNGLISLDEFKTLQNSGNYETEIADPTATRLMVINAGAPITSDIKVRQALEHAIEKQTISDHVFNGIEKKADMLISDNFPYSAAGLKPYDYNLQTAEQLLNEAGWLRPAKGEYRMKDGKELALELKYIRTDSIQKALAEVVQGELKKIGILVKLAGLEEQSFWDDAFAGKFDLVFDETWGAPYDPHSYVSAMRAADHSSSSYAAQTALPVKQELDALIGKTLISTDEQARAALYKEIFTILHDQAVYIPISYETNIAVLQKKVKGFAFPSTPYEIPFTNLEVKS